MGDIAEHEWSRDGWKGRMKIELLNGSILGYLLNYRGRFNKIYGFYYTRTNCPSGGLGGIPAPVCGGLYFFSTIHIQGEDPSPLYSLIMSRYVHRIPCSLINTLRYVSGSVSVSSAIPLVIVLWPRSGPVSCLMKCIYHFGHKLSDCRGLDFWTMRSTKKKFSTTTSKDMVGWMVNGWRLECFIT